jgi:hypothetical protein
MRTFYHSVPLCCLFLLCFILSCCCCWKCKVHMTYCTIIYSLFSRLKPPHCLSTRDNKKEWSFLYYKKRPQFNVLISTKITWGRDGEDERMGKIERSARALKNFWIMVLNKTYLIGRTNDIVRLDYLYFNTFLALQCIIFMAHFPLNPSVKWDLFNKKD